MTPKQIRLHDRCQCSIRWKLFQGKLEPTPALFCKEHNAWIQWLKDHEALALIDSGLEEEIYIKPTRPKRKTRDDF
jgi:hypothetical protein